MTLGFVLVFIGIQLNLVETYVLTPRVSNFLMENAPREDPQSASYSMSGNANNPAFNSPYYQASYPGGGSLANQQPTAGIGQTMLGTPKSFSPPNWLCWPVLFLGTVVFLHGLSVQRE